jgi:hypothetical protein
MSWNGIITEERRECLPTLVLYGRRKGTFNAGTYWLEREGRSRGSHSRRTLQRPSMWRCQRDHHPLLRPPIRVPTLPEIVGDQSRSFVGAVLLSGPVAIATQLTVCDCVGDRFPIGQQQARQRYLSFGRYIWLAGQAFKAWLNSIICRRPKELALQNVFNARHVRLETGGERLELSLHRSP